MSKGIEINQRDILIFKIIYMFRYCVGRHIKELASFPSANACDKRLKKLVDSKLIERKKYIYGIPYLYTLAHKGRMLLGVNKRAETIRLDQVRHDIIVIDCAIYFLKLYNLDLDNITTEKELHSKNGFAIRKHAPDFVITKNDEAIAFEIELTAKQKSTLENNIKANYINFDNQVWITDDDKIKRNILELQNKYNLKVIDLEVIKNGV